MLDNPERGDLDPAVDDHWYYKENFPFYPAYIRRNKKAVTMAEKLGQFTAGAEERSVSLWKSKESGKIKEL